MFTARNFRRRKNQPTKHHLSKTFAGSSSTIITSDAYGGSTNNSFLTMKSSTPEQPCTPRSMDFLSYNGCWNERTRSSPSKAGCASDFWHFMQVDADSLPAPPSPPDPPKIKRRAIKFSNKSRNLFQVGDYEQETRTPLSSITNHLPSNQNGADDRIMKVQEPKRKYRRGILRSLLTPKASNCQIPNLTIAATLSTSATEPLSDDDDSIWNEIQTPRRSASRDLSIKYSRRSEISDGSSTIQLTASDIARRALRPNCTHMNAAYWTERNLRPYMEDRVLIDRIGSTVPAANGEMSIPALLDRLDDVGGQVPGTHVHADSIPFGPEAISVYSVFDGHAGALASQFCSDWFSSYLVRQPSFYTNLPRALSSTFKNIDRDFMSTGNRDGTTACVCVIVGGKRIVCANAGDSRAIIVKRDGTFVPLSTDHKPGTEKEARRILELGGKISFNGSWRVEG
jgi:hypothetical protein